MQSGVQPSHGEQQTASTRVNKAGQFSQDLLKAHVPAEMCSSVWGTTHGCPWSVRPSPALGTGPVLEAWKHLMEFQTAPVACALS